MKQAVSFITVGVRDLATSLRFYRDGLGWAPTFEVPGEISFFQVAPGVLLGVWSLERLGHDSGGPMDGGQSVALAQNFETEAEVDAAYERALAAGAASLKAPQRHPEIAMYHAYVADPDGHRWELACNPGWSVDEDGSVRIG